MKRKRDFWNKCAVCGRFIAYDDFDNGASRILITPDTPFSCEKWESICRNCNKK